MLLLIYVYIFLGSESKKNIYIYRPDSDFSLFFFFNSLLGFLIRLFFGSHSEVPLPFCFCRLICLSTLMKEGKGNLSPLAFLAHDVDILIFFFSYFVSFYIVYSCIMAR